MIDKQESGKQETRLVNFLILFWISHPTIVRGNGVPRDIETKQIPTENKYQNQSFVSLTTQPRSNQ